jgi:hypothetical protein
MNLVCAVLDVVCRICSRTSRAPFGITRRHGNVVLALHEIRVTEMPLLRFFRAKAIYESSIRLISHHISDPCGEPMRKSG